MVIAIINQKGGVGKTTLAVHLACHFFDLGRTVRFIDNDPQQSSSRWLGAAEPSIRVETPGTEEGLVDSVRDAQNDADIVVCDAAPRLNDQTHVLMFMADRILVPVRASQLDIEATYQTKLSIDKVDAARRLEDEYVPPSVRLIMNMVRTVGDQARKMRDIIDHLRLPLAKQTIGLRDAYSKAVLCDSVITRMHNDTGAAVASVELISLFNEVLPDANHATANLAA